MIYTGQRLHSRVKYDTMDSIMENDGAVIEVQQVNFVFQDKPVLENVTMTVKTGAFLAIIGPNGAGKTTLLRIILGLLKPTTGTVRVFGKDTHDLGDYRHRIAYVPQLLSADLRFPVSVEEVVLMGRYGRMGFGKGPSKKDRELCRDMMVKVGIESLSRRPLSRLSGGQLQRVLLARALANEPELLILDEPTSGVDQTTTFNLYEMLRELHKEKITILMVSHDVGVVANFVDGVACLNRKLIVHGKPSEVLTSVELEQMYGCEAVFLHHCRIPQLIVEDR
jgi:zinc transport system ATP-binding protein